MYLSGFGVIPQVALDEWLEIDRKTNSFPFLLLYPHTHTHTRAHVCVLVSSRDVLCGFLFCANLTAKPKFGDLQGDVTSLTIYHQNKYMDCR